MWGTPTWRLRVVISGVISSLIWVIRIVTLLITRLITTHEPPSSIGVMLGSEASLRVGFSQGSCFASLAFRV